MSDQVKKPEDCFSHNEAHLAREVPNTTIAEFANTGKPDKKAHAVLSHLDLQCLPSSL